MKLPPLPKLRQKKEADITPLVEAWFIDNWDHSCAVEVKIKGGRIRNHQPVALKQVDKGRFSYKIPDRGARNPFDLIILKGADAFIVVCDGRQCTAYTYDMIEQFKFRV